MLTHQGPDRAFHASGVEGVRRAWHFGDGDRAGSDGHPIFYPAEGKDAVAYHKTAAALSKFSKTGLTDIEDIVPFIRFLVSEGWWMTGQTILVNGGYSTK